MKYRTILLVFVLCLVLASLAGTAIMHAQSASQPATVHLATSMNHITVLEFGEPVTQAAVGSSAFNVEWRANKVLIKPLKSGASTDLFVWTAARRFTYELDPPGEAKTMNYAVDNLTPVKPLPAAPTDAQMMEIADMVVTRALLAADRIDSSTVKDRKGNVIVRVENIFQSANSVYVRYSITNLTAQAYRVPKPKVSQLSSVYTGVSLQGLEKTQLGSDLLRTLRDAKRDSLPVINAEVSKEDLAPGETTHGVMVLRQQFTSPAVLEFNFAGGGGRDVSATFVL